MTTISASKLQRNINRCIQKSQRERVVIVQHGKPAAVIVGVRGMDWENVILDTDPTFWCLIHNRRSQSALSLDAFKKRIKYK